MSADNLIPKEEQEHFVDIFLDLLVEVEFRINPEKDILAKRLAESARSLLARSISHKTLSAIVEAADKEKFRFNTNTVVVDGSVRPDGSFNTFTLPWGSPIERLLWEQKNKSTEG